MRVITESEGVRVEAGENGDAYVWLPGLSQPRPVYSDIPSEALLAIVADRLKARDEHAAEFFAAGHVDEAIRELKGYSTRLRPRSPAPQKQGRG